MNQSNPVGDCLTNEQIESLLASDSTARADTQRIDLHLNSCTACQQRVEQRLEIELSATGTAENVPRQRHLTALPHGVANLDRGEEDIPNRLGRYHLLEEIGSGGMGRVFKAFDPDLQRHCALKVMNVAVKGDPELMERFRREALAAARLEHASIVKVYEFGEDAGTVFLVMEWLDGHDLSQTSARLSQDPLRSACQIVHDAADAIAHAHAAGIVHRDLKPSNLLLTNDSTVKIVDFGLAKDLTNATDLTATGAFVGTISYSAPEQVAGAAASAEPPIDIYALGAILYDLLCGRPPFKTNDIVLTLTLIQKQDPLPPRKLNPAVDRDLETICLKCLAKDPAARYASAADLRNDLRRYLNGETIQARRPPPYVAAYRWAKRRPALTAAWLLAACLLIAAAVGVPLWSARELRLERLESERKLAEQREEASRRVAEARARVSTAWRIRSMQTQATAWLDEQIYFVTNELGFDIPQALRGIDTRILQRRISQGRLLVVDHWIDGDQPMLAVANSPDGSRIATADASGRVTLWDKESGEPIRRLTEIPLGDDVNATIHYMYAYWKNKTDDEPIPPLPYPTDLCWVPDATKIVAPTIDGRVLLLSTEGAEARELTTTDDSLHCAALVADDLVVVAGAKGTVWLVDVTGGEVLTSKKVSGKEIRVLHSLGGQRFLAGDAAGVLSLVEVTGTGNGAENKKPNLWKKTSLKLGEPIHCLAAGSVDDPSDVKRLFVGMASNRLAAVNVDPLTARLNKEPQHDVVLQNEQLSAVHDLVMDNDRQQLHALDDLGRMWVVSPRTGRTVYRTERLMTNNSFDMMDIRMRSEEIAIPTPYRRRGRIVLFPDRPDRFGLAGTNAAIAVHQLPTHRGRFARRLGKSLGDAAALQFDPTQDQLLWALRRDGTLLLVDVGSNRILDERPAHEGGAMHGICRGANGTVITSGADGRILSWQVADWKIIPVSEPVIKPHDMPLLSIAYCPISQQLAAVDQQSTLLLWNAVDGKLVHSVELDENHEQPHTGKVEFNSDGTQLIAFGAKQSAHGFRLNPLERLSDQPAINSLGGTGITFSPADPNKVIVCDPLYVQALDYGDTLTNLNEDILQSTVSGNCVASTGSLDARRLACLHQNGAVRFLDPEIMITVNTMRVPLANCVDLSFSANSDRLAVVNESGEIALLEAVRGNDSVAENANAKPANPPWTRNRLFETEDHLFTTTHAIRFDSKGNVHTLLSPQKPVVPGAKSRDFRTDGAVVYIRESEHGSAEQSLLSEKMVHRLSTGLVLDSDDRPVVVLRQRLPSEISHYEGDALVLKPAADGEWKSQRYVRGFNMGYFPIIDLDPSGDVRSIVHFSYRDYALYRSTPGEASDEEWPREMVGLRGDGESMDQITPLGDRIMFRLEQRRFFPELGSYYLMQLDPDGELTRLARLHPESNNLFIRSDGAAFAVLRDMSTPRAVRYGVYRLVSGEWEKCLALEGRYAGYFRNSFVVTADDTLNVVVPDSVANTLVMFSDKIAPPGMPPEKFEPEAMRIDAHQGEILQHLLMLDRQDQPVIAIYTREGERNSFDILRPAAGGS